MRRTTDHAVQRDFDVKQSLNTVHLKDAVRHIASFSSGVWQVHPFAEGNTRTTAVFIIKYLNTLGFEVNNEPFAEHSWYFRNALVRANYANLTEGVVADASFLEKFFENLLLGKSHELKNRALHIDCASQLVGKFALGINDSSVIAVLT